MDICRVCLSVGPDKYIYQLTLYHEECAVQYHEIVGLCLGNEYLEQKTKANKLCNECFNEILRFYIFKSKALKNDAYLRSINSDSIEIQDTIKNEKNVKLDLTEIKDTVENGSIRIEIYEEKKSNLRKEETNENNLVCQEDDSKETEINIKNVQDEVKFEVLEDEFYFVNENTNLDEENTDECESDNEASNPGPAEADSDASEELSASHVGPNPPNDPDYNPPIDYQRLRKIQRKRLKEKVQPSGSVPVQLGNKTPCPVCNNMYAADYLRKHMVRVHWNRKKPCPYCNREFSVYNLKTHITLMHEPEKMKYKCEKCDKRFIKPSYLRDHWCPSDGPITRKRNPAVLSFSCTQCKVRLQSSESLQKHVARIHEGTHRFLCHYCSKGFDHKKGMLHHIRTHTKEKPYQCDQCLKRFATTTALRRHDYTHTESREFRCEQCSKSFASPYYLAHHIHNVHSAARFPCRYCALQFTRPDNRNTHEKNKHADEMPPFEVTLNGIIVNKETEESSVVGETSKLDTKSKT